MKDPGSGWRAFAAWLTRAVVVVLAGLALTFLGAWIYSRLVRGESANLLAVFGAKIASAALVACGLTLAWNYFSRIKHSATWLVRLWLFCFVFAFMLTSRNLPWWFELAGAIAFIGFILWARRAWGPNWLEMDDSTRGAEHA